MPSQITAQLTEMDEGLLGTIAYKILRVNSYGGTIVSITLYGLLLRKK